jgi:hypothetical protein
VRMTIFKCEGSKWPAEGYDPLVNLPEDLTRLTKTERNELFRAVQADGLGLDPGQCELRALSATKLHIGHRRSGSLLRLYKSGPWEAWLVDWTVDSRPRENFPSSWESVLDYVQAWANAAREYVDTPDLWAQIHSPDFLASPTYEESENSAFTADEQTAISAQLREIKNYLKEEGSLSEEQMARVQARLDETEEASRRIGRKDWVLLFSGAIFSLIITDLITPEVAQHILMLTFHGLGHLFAGGVRAIPGR